MQRTTTIAGIGIAAAVAATAGIVAGTHHTTHATQPGVSSGAIKTVTATVNGTTETVLTNAQGMPLYYYVPDSPTRSLVSGGLAALWPPVTSATTPAATGLSGTLRVVHDSHGNQVAYNGHLLYTFVSDHAGVVTGQNIQNFKVATPNLSAAPGSSGSSGGGSGTGYGGSYGGY